MQRLKNISSSFRQGNSLSRFHPIGSARLTATSHRTRDLAKYRRPCQSTLAVRWKFVRLLGDCTGHTSAHESTFAFKMASPNVW
ncbi:hypothetical protein PILCRDRAFT_227531 [Piloderma croceum F 1598]|uniref:Uncharacterized protein n=1 Tax=Piloderma croceum (strain F 1598) TaxID=765440 RepID=A0A0C3CIB2_PILCF|nr:hypothetical protein PILCRDRAFT_227531 [Piloderma croceum F 1598]